MVTWGEFVELGYLRQYRRKEVPFQRLRPVIEALRQEFGTPYPLAAAKPFTYGKGADPRDPGEGSAYVDYP